MYASEKVLQMSYANYQFVLLLGFPCRSGANLRIPEGRKPSWRSSRTRPLWTSVNPGGPKFFTRVAHNRGALYVPGAARLHGLRTEEHDRGERHMR